ncbi:MAG: flagellar basal body rod protein FlgC [Pseudomonadales bacterium]|uniref:Flagellar basal-body rod protein FlgC n=1 Tax=Oleiphilus messinensis TaxID=141451 RepID=A0A1Y0IBG1_9GAMM|nr:flagellar basal body rod protein FlgC [Oleiphilus messinensis]ARU57106.1 flagellar basal-body rod protein C [Oleiphilus messinensis]MCG8612736.1 flagellar basal body rod protein FlgC [Pseudomonadales bacterium]
MSLSQIFDIAGSGMSAQSIRLNTTASNLANAETASSSTDEVYRARKPIFATIHQGVMHNQSPTLFGDDLESKGVQVKAIVESDEQLQMRYQPEHPLANEQGYVYYPNVNVVEEMADMMSASRSFQTNVDVMNSAKQMMQRILTLGQ